MNYEDLSIVELHELVGTLHRKARALAPRFYEDTANAGATNPRPTTPRRIKCWELVAEAGCVNEVAGYREDARDAKNAASEAPAVAAVAANQSFVDEYEIAAARPMVDIDRDAYRESYPPADECECSEEFGPCMDHSELLAQRSGASNRTADELALVFLMDVRDAVADASTLTITASARDALVDSLTENIADAFALPWDDIHRGANHDGDGWLDIDIDPDASEVLQDMVRDAESALSDVGLEVYWDDGYIISRMSEDCPLRDGYAYGNPDDAPIDLP